MAQRPESRSPRRRSGVGHRRSQAVALWPRPRRRLRIVAASLLGGLVLLFGAPLLLLFGAEPARAPSRYLEAVTGEPPLLNPVLAPYTLAGQDVLPLVFSGLVQADPTGTLSGDLAEHWEISPDGRVYTFRLRDGLTWHDEMPLDAHDVVFTIQLVQAPDHQGSQELADLWRGVAVEAADARTIRFSLPEPLASFPDHLTLGLLPRHLLEGVPASALPHHPFNRQPIGSGPYRVASLEPTHLKLERYAGYHGPAPRLEQVELRFFDERGQAVEALLHGEVDGLAHLRAEEVERLSAAPGLAVYSAPERSKLAMLALNVQTPLLRDRRVRLALARGLDREALVRRALGGQAEPAFGPIPVQSWAYARPAGDDAHDLTGAATLLDAAGWTLGHGGIREREGQTLALTILTAETAERVTVAEELGRQLVEMGFEVTVRALPADELTEEHLEPRRFEAAVVGQWTMGSDPDVYALWHSSQAAQHGGNYAGYSDPDIDRWLEVGRQSLRLEDRRNAYIHFQARWAEEQPSVILYHPLYSFALSHDVHGVAADPIPDSSWRLRGVVNWERRARPTPLQRVRARLVDLLGRAET